MTRRQDNRRFPDDLSDSKDAVRGSGRDSTPAQDATALGVLLRWAAADDSDRDDLRPEGILYEKDFGEEYRASQKKYQDFLDELEPYQDEIQEKTDRFIQREQQEMEALRASMTPNPEGQALFNRLLPLCIEEARVHGGKILVKTHAFPSICSIVLYTPSVFFDDRLSACLDKHLLLLQATPHERGVRLEFGVECYDA